MIRFDAVLFDLDDTLFLQSTWLDGAWAAVAAAASWSAGVAEDELRAALVEIASTGSAGGRIIDRALAAVGRADLAVEPLVDAFRRHAPAALPLLPGASELIGCVRRERPAALVTDGDPLIQRSKLSALGLSAAFDAVVFSDELGRELRKPHPAPFVAALEALGVAPGDAVFVGDNPLKDVAGAAAVGMRTIRVRTGEYAHLDGEVAPDHEVADLREVWGLLG